MMRSLVLCLAAATALPLAAQDRAPEVSRKGRTVVSFRDDKVQAILGYRWMNANPKATWVPLQFAISATNDGNVDIAREDITLTTPSGERLPLPTQAAFQEGVRQPEGILRAVSVSRDPIAEYFPGRFRVVPLSFFVVQEGLEGSRHDWHERHEGPIHGLAYDSTTVDRNTLAIGLLWFHLPAGAAPGRYRLEIQNKWAHVDLPFEVPAPPLGKGRTDEGLTW